MYRAMVTSPHELATQAGLDILRVGGNAIEASIVVSACLSVTYPHFSGFGGDAFLILSNADGQVQTISGIGQAAQNISGYDKSIPLRGPRAMLTTAGNIEALGKAYDISRNQFRGKMTWAELLAPAIALARDGFPISKSQRFWLEFRKDEMALLPGVASAFLKNENIPSQGYIVRQPRLASTLETLAQNGYRDFYEGALAFDLAKGLKDVGSPLTLTDLKATQARLEPPLHMPYRGGILYSLQPPTQGVTTLEIMGILQHFDMSKIAEGSADYFHVLVEAVKLAFLDRNRSVADPDFINVPIMELLGEANLTRLASQIKMGCALPWPHVFNTGDTVFIAAADAHGNAVSMLSTVFFDWGSGIMVGDTGLLWHNRGAAFSVDPAHPNVLQPGKRPFHTLNPGMYLKHGKPHILYGTQGADGQPQTLAAILTRMIDYKMSPEVALARPRFLLGKTFSNTQDTLKLESDVGEGVIKDLQQRGHEVSLIPEQSPLAGHPGAIMIELDGSMCGAHDPRSDGRALGSGHII
jgi:oxamate amidohydrolase